MFQIFFVSQNVTCSVADVFNEIFFCVVNVFGKMSSIVKCFVFLIAFCKISFCVFYAMYFVKCHVKSNVTAF